MPYVGSQFQLDNFYTDLNLIAKALSIPSVPTYPKTSREHSAFNISFEGMSTGKITRTFSDDCF